MDPIFYFMLTYTHTHRKRWNKNIDARLGDGQTNVQTVCFGKLVQGLDVLKQHQS